MAGEYKGYKIAILAVALGLAGCAAQPRAVVYAVPKPVPADAALQACADHAAAGIRASGQSDFRRLRLETSGLYKAPFQRYVGNTYVDTIQDGHGEWFGANSWRKVRFHCLSDGSGQVVYSFVRGE
ncbi:MAG: hypothetical protein H6922_04890 [Pseudomonadaceae bacterium]|nr:hypothetical protein [Pseudomonadaceae bacterium]